MPVHIERPTTMKGWVQFRELTGHSMASSRGIDWPLSVDFDFEEGAVQEFVSWLHETDLHLSIER